MQKELRGLSAQEQYVVGLVQSYQSGDLEAYNKIYSLSYPGIYYFVLKMVRDQYEAQDITQEVFVAVYQNLKKLKEPQSFKKWINRIAWHSTIDYLKSRRMNSTAGCDLDALLETDELEEQISDAGEQILATERHNVVMSAVDQLNPMLRTTVLLRFFNDLKEREIAEIMDVPLGTVKRRLMIAKKQLSGKLTGMYSVFPYFFLRHSAAKQCRKALGCAEAAVPAALWKRGALATGVTAGIAAAVVMQGPSIQELYYYGDTHYVNEQTVEWTVSSVLPIKEVCIEGRSWRIEEENGLYRVNIPENGSYMLTVTDVAGQRAEQLLEITNIDSEAPIYCTYREEHGSHMRLRFQDALSGINWERTEFRNVDGEQIQATAIDRQKGEVLFPADCFPLEIQVEDMAGNYSVYALQRNTIEYFEDEEAADEEI